MLAQTIDALPGGLKDRQDEPPLPRPVVVAYGEHPPDHQRVGRQHDPQRIAGVNRGQFFDFAAARLDCVEL